MTGVFIVVMENTAWPFDYPARRVEIEADSEQEARRLALAQDPFGAVVWVEGQVAGLGSGGGSGLIEADAPRRR
ncbi:hypothetical protein CBW24_07870 [Pacificitalea manganoxidans]|uniref:Uncharacterized protein n=1 Tax=Pacificitalea manganoxidans TaxID=1411902 RepID=A0A291LYV6_9RHOB|nr:hypothetical protein CBW24_07870 [Pacificitalea manganoxidans]